MKLHSGYFLFFYFLVWLLVFPFAKGYFDNPDTVSYIESAIKLKNGMVAESISSYWSPLISWLLVPFLFFTSDYILAFKIVQLIMGTWACIQVKRIIQQFPLSNWLQSIIMVAASFLVLSYSMLVLSADLLFLSATLWLVVLLTKINTDSPDRRLYKIGLAGALMFLSKASGIIIFPAILLLHFLIMRTQSQNTSNRFLLLPLLVFIPVAMLWTGIISFHEKHFTISRAATFNLSREASHQPGTITKLPVVSSNYFPLKQNDWTPWFNPGRYASLTPLQPFGNGSDAAQYITTIRRNLLTIYYNDFKRQAGIFFLGLAALYFYSGYQRRSSIPINAIFLMGVYILFYCMYALILVHPRYVWICQLFSLIIAACFFNQLIKQAGLYKYLSWILFPAFLALSLKKPVKEILYTYDRNTSIFSLINDVLHTSQTLESIYRASLNDYTFMKSMQDKINLENKMVVYLGDTAAYSFSKFGMAALYARGRFAGQAGFEETATLETEGIIYYFIATKDSSAMELKNLKTLFRDKHSGIQLLSIDLTDQ